MAGVFIRLKFLLKKCFAWEKSKCFQKTSLSSYFTLLDAWAGSKVFLSDYGFQELRLDL